MASFLRYAPLATLLVLLAPATAPADPWAIGSFGISAPFGVTVAPNGETYVASPFAHRIEKYSKYGTHLLGWGTFGSGPGQLDYPTGVAVDIAGNVLVTDTNNNRITQFSSSGVYITQFGSAGSGPGQFADPRGVAVDPAGDIYVADTFNHRVQRLEPSGLYHSEWGSQGTGDGQFSYPWGIAIDAAGDVYVADTYNHRIQKFTSSGVFLKSWGSLGTGPGQFTFPTAVAIDGGGNVYVTDTNNSRVQRFTSKGVYVSEWGSQGSNPWQFWAPQGIAVTPDGDVYVSDTNNHRLKIFRHREASRHEAVYAIGSPGGTPGQFSAIAGIAVAPNGHVFVADRTANRIQSFNANTANWIGEWPIGDPELESCSPVGVAVDATGFVYVTDNYNSRVRKFSPSGSFLLEWGSPGAGPGEFQGVWDIAIDKSNNVYVVDANRVQKFSTAGAYLTEWSCSGATGVCTDLEGYVYVTCFGDDMVRRYAPDGTPVTEWGGTGSNPGQFFDPWDVVADSSGYVYVCDASGRIQQFTAIGGWVTEWGEPGSELRQLGTPVSMATDAAGSIYVTEFSNYRFQKFVSPPELLEVADVPGDEGGSVRLRFTHSSAEGTGLFSEYAIYRLDPFIYSLVGTVPVDGVTTTAVVPSPGNATDVYTGIQQYEVRAYLPVSGSFVPRGINYGYSLDNLAPPAPSPFTAGYVDGATNLHWGASPATDLDEYRVYRSDSSPVAFSPANLIHASPDTGYADIGDAGRYYGIVAADTSGNVSAPSLVGPNETVSAPTSSLEFRLEEVLPNPVRGSAPFVRFVLPDAGKARLELVNVAGRSVWSREVSGAGPHALRVGGERRLGTGIYFVRLTRNAQSLVRRIAVVD